MNKPKKPSKTVEIEYNQIIYLDKISSKVSLKLFNKIIKGIVPKEGYDETICLEQEPEYCYCNDYCCNHTSTTYLKVYWKQKIPNTQYES